MLYKPLQSLRQGLRFSIFDVRHSGSSKLHTNICTRLEQLELTRCSKCWYWFSVMFHLCFEFVKSYVNFPWHYEDDKIYKEK